MSAPVPAGLVTLDGLAERLGVSVATARRRRAGWERGGMPCPLPWRAAPLVWRREEIERWIEEAERRAGARAAAGREETP